jgi:hypothetical protein
MKSNKYPLLENGISRSKVKEGKQRNAPETKLTLEDFNDVIRLLNAKAKGHLH